VGAPRVLGSSGTKNVTHAWLFEIVQGVNRFEGTKVAVGLSAAVAVAAACACSKVIVCN